MPRNLSSDFLLSYDMDSWKDSLGAFSNIESFSYEEDTNLKSASKDESDPVSPVSPRTTDKNKNTSSFFADGPKTSPGVIVDRVPKHNNRHTHVTNEPETIDTKVINPTVNLSSIEEKPSRRQSDRLSFTLSDVDHLTTGLPQIQTATKDLPISRTVQGPASPIKLKISTSPVTSGNSPYNVLNSYFPNAPVQAYNFQPVVTSDHLAFRLAQNVVDLAVLPQLAKNIEMGDPTEDFMEPATPTSPQKSASADGPAPVFVFNPIQHDLYIRHVAAVICKTASGHHPIPLVNIVNATVLQPPPRSAGIPTNVTVPNEDTMDRQTLKRLRNRISASRCRAKRRAWVNGIENAYQSLESLQTHLETYVTKLEEQKQALMRMASLANENNSS